MSRAPHPTSRPIGTHRARAAGTMRSKHISNLSFSVFALAAIAVAPVACSHAFEDTDSTSSAALTDEDLAKAALRDLGAKVPGAEGNCVQCHDINKATLRLWAAS